MIGREVYDHYEAEIGITAFAGSDTSRTGMSFGDLVLRLNGPGRQTATLTVDGKPAATGEFVVSFIQ